MQSSTPGVEGLGISGAQPRHVVVGAVEERRELRLDRGRAGMGAVEAPVVALGPENALGSYPFEAGNKAARIPFAVAPREGPRRDTQGLPDALSTAPGYTALNYGAHGGKRPHSGRGWEYEQESEKK
jgi:hypothetical protein